MELLSLYKLRCVACLFICLFLRGCSSKVQTFHGNHCPALEDSFYWVLRKRRGQRYHRRILEAIIPWGLHIVDGYVSSQVSLIFVLSSWFSVSNHSKPIVCLDYGGMIKGPSSLSHLPQAIACASAPPNLASPSCHHTMTVIIHTLLWIQFCFAPTSMGWMFQTLFSSQQLLGCIKPLFPGPLLQVRSAHCVYWATTKCLRHLLDKYLLIKTMYQVLDWILKSK